MKLARVVFVPALHPDDANAEEFFAPEVRELAGLVDVLQVPLRPRTRSDRAGIEAVRLLAPAVLATAARVAARSPIRVARAVRPLIDPRRPGKALRQLACVPKALWLSSRLRHGDVVVAGWLTTPAAAAMVSAGVADVPWVTYAHRRDIEEAGSLRAKVSDAAFVRVVAEASAAALSERVGEPHRFRLIHLGVDLPAGMAPLPRRDVLRVVAVGHLIPLKNHETAIRALAAAGDARVDLTIVGTGPLAPELGRLADDLGVGHRVHLEGYLAHSELLRRLELGTWDLMSSCSTTEGIPVSLMEALAAGLPVVASDVGGVAELVRPAGGTLIADPFDHHSLASAWAATASRWTEAAAAHARAVVAQDFSAASSARRLFDELSGVVGGCEPYRQP